MALMLQNVLFDIYWRVSQLDFSGLVSNVLPVIGIAVISRLIWKIGSDIILFFIHESTLLKFRSTSGVSWAFVSGASDGIGRGCAEELLSRGFNVVLHGRNLTKLEGVKSELLKQWPDRQIHLVVLDVAASARDHAAVKLIISELKAKRIKISVLINNVGGASNVAKAWVPLHQRDGKEIDTLIDVNATFATQLTRVLLPMLFESKPSLIINIGSVTGQLPSPYLTPYAGSKAYIGAWSRSLKAELFCEKKDVEVLHINVGEVRAQHDRSAPTLFAPSSRRMGKAILDSVGCGRTDVCAYWPHALQLALISAIPEPLLNVVMIKVALQKKEEEEEKKKNSKTD